MDTKTIKNNWVVRTGRYSLVLSIAVAIAACGGNDDADELRSRVSIAAGNYSDVVIDSPNTLVQVSGRQQLNLFAVVDGETIESTETTDNSLASSASWRSSDNNIATVNSTGLVTGVADGQVVITGGFGPLADSIELEVTSALITGLVIDQPSVDSINECTNLQLSAMASFAAIDGQGIDVTRHVTWALTEDSTTGFFSDTDDSGLLRTNTSGVATVVATLTNSDEIDVNGSIDSPSVAIVVNDNLAGIEIVAPDATLTVSNPVSYTALATFASNSDGQPVEITDNATWSTDDATLAEIDDELPAKGQLVAKQNGAINISAVCGGLDVPAMITVLAGDANRVEEVFVTPDSPLVIAFEQVENPRILKSFVKLENQTEVEITEDSSWSLVESDANAQINNTSGSKGELTITGPGTFRVQVEYTGDTYTSGNINIARLEVEVQ